MKLLHSPECPTWEMRSNSDLPVDSRQTSFWKELREAREETAFQQQGQTIYQFWQEINGAHFRDKNNKTEKIILLIR